MFVYIIDDSDLVAPFPILSRSSVGDVDKFNHKFGYRQAIKIVSGINFYTCDAVQNNVGYNFLITLMNYKTLNITFLSIAFLENVPHRIKFCNVCKIMGGISMYPVCAKGRKMFLVQIKLLIV